MFINIRIVSVKCLKLIKNATYCSNTRTISVFAFQMLFSYVTNIHSLLTARIRSLVGIDFQIYYSYEYFNCEFNHL